MYLRMGGGEGRRRRGGGGGGIAGVPEEGESVYSVLMSPGVLTSVLRNVELLPVSVSVECLSSGPVKHCVKAF